jgi:hypothetical protein
MSKIMIFSHCPKRTSTEMWAEEEATGEDEETEPTLDVEGAGRQEQGAGSKRGKGREDPNQPSMKEFIPDPRARPFHVQSWLRFLVLSCCLFLCPHFSRCPLGTM